MKYVPWWMWTVDALCTFILVPIILFHRDSILVTVLSLALIWLATIQFGIIKKKLAGSELDSRKPKEVENER